MQKIFPLPLTSSLLSLILSSSSLSSVSSGLRSLETLCLQVTDLFPGLRRMQSVLPEHGCLLVSPGNYWQNQRELFDSDPDLLKTIQKHEPKGLHTSATLRGRDEEGRCCGRSKCLSFLSCQRAWDVSLVTFRIDAHWGFFYFKVELLCYYFL